MKISEFRKLIKEEVRKILKEANETTLSQLKLGDKFTIASDATVKGNQQYYPLNQAKYGTVQFQVVKINPSSILTIPYNQNGKYPKNVFWKQGTTIGNITFDTPPILPQTVAANPVPSSMRPSVIGMIGSNWETGDIGDYKTSNIWTVTFVTSKGDTSVNLV